MNYRPVIGLEIHAELKTASKMFCSCKNDPFNSPPNTNVCPICLGFPGTLPVPNRQAIEWTVMTGMALHCEPKSSKFDRKNYFYPDLPKGYQISQYDLPFTTNGWLEVAGKKVRIRRIHLEEDTGKLVHPEDKTYSLVDFNRAGVPLIELVTEPEITSPQMASVFAKELQLILRHIGASNADMEKGQLRVEANVSVRTTDKALGAKVEIKNLNSFRSVERAIAFEIERHTKLLEEGKKVVQETRGWDEDRGETFSQRTKEEAEDYRYFPEPDIPPFRPLGIEAATVEMPEEKRQKYLGEGLNKHEVGVLVRDPHFARFSDDVTVASGIAHAPVARWIINEGIDPKWGVDPVADLIVWVQDPRNSITVAKEAIKEAKATGKLEIPKEGQVISDQEQLASIIDEVIKAHPKPVTDYRAGKKEAFGFLVGQVMAKTRGRADPKSVNALLRKALEK